MPVHADPVGALLKFGDGKTVAHLVIRRPRHPTENHLYIDLEDAADRFSGIFEDIVRHCSSDERVVPVGFPAGETFQCTEARPRVDVLKDGSGAGGWLPMVMVITPRRRGGHAEAIMQIRTDENAERELNQLSHLAGHILQSDRLRADVPPTAMRRSFGPADDIPLSAARRVVEEVTGNDLSSAMRPVTTGSYLYPDKEHLFFYIYVLDLPEGVQFPRRAEMHPFPLPELLAIRYNWVLRSAAELCRKTHVPQRTWATGALVVALNLALHDAEYLGETMLDLIGQKPDKLTETASMIEQLITDKTSPSWVAPGHEIRIHGLAGWQHREFFKILLPLYSEIGIRGASDLLGEIRSDPQKRGAIDRLAEMYQDEHLMAALPVEL